MHITKMLFCFTLFAICGNTYTETRKEKLTHELSERTYNKTLISKIVLASTAFALTTTAACFFSTWIRAYQRDHVICLKFSHTLSLFLQHLEKYAVPATIISNLYWLYNNHRIAYLEKEIEKELQPLQAQE